MTQCLQIMKCKMRLKYLIYPMRLQSNTITINHFLSLKIHINFKCMMFWGHKWMVVQNVQWQIILTFLRMCSGIINGFVLKHRWEVQHPIMLLFHRQRFLYKFQLFKKENGLVFAVIILQNLHQHFCLIMMCLIQIKFWKEYCGQ